jgi:hypothetical protein
VIVIPLATLPPIKQPLHAIESMNMPSQLLPEQYG